MLSKIIKEEVSNFLNEIHYSDYTSETFAQFVNTYKRKVKKGEIYAGEYYVQFTNYADNKMDRTAFNSPDHADPVGVYAYPLNYVLNYPADIWYGKSAKFIRVLRDTSKNKLVVNTIDTESQMRYVLRKLGFTSEEINIKSEIALNAYKDRYTGKNKYAKLFMSIIQLDLDSTPEEIEASLFSKAKKQYPVKSGAEQTKVLTRFYDAIEDVSRNQKDAILNAREPNQVIFFNRGAFRVQEIIRIHGNDKFANDNMTHITSDKIERKLAAGIAIIMDDKLTGQIKNNLSSNKYWTVKKRRIDIETFEPNNFRDGLSFGEKRHKFDKTNDKLSFKIIINTEFGSIVNKYEDKDKFIDIIKDIKEDFVRIQKNPKETDWVGETKKDFEKAEERERQEYFRKEREKELQETIRYLPKFLERLKVLAEAFNLPFTPYETDLENVKLYNFYESIFNILARSHPKTLEEFKDDVYTRWVERYGEDDEPNKQLRDIIYKYFFYNPSSLKDSGRRVDFMYKNPEEFQIKK